MTTSIAYQGDRARVLAHYGRSCRCCGATADLSIDHVTPCLEGRHRRSASDFYRWLIRHRFPAGFQTLCMPCNRSKGPGTWCRIHNKLLGAAA